MMNNIALVVVYFGELPFYLPAFLVSCSFNPGITWLIFSDCTPPKKLPHNVQFVEFTPTKFCQLASEKLGFKVILSNNYFYKICDYKPAYGVIFEEYLQSYQFWGHCDLDIVWGRIDHFIDDDLLSNYQIITSRPNRISGHFCIYRNEKQINSIFLSMPKTIENLKVSDQCRRLDEDYFTRYLTWLHNPTILSRFKQLFYGTPYKPSIYWQRILTTAGAHQRAMLKDDSLVMRWKKGAVFYGEQEIMYLHFHVLKNSLNSIDFTSEDKIDEFILTSKEIKKVCY